VTRPAVEVSRVSKTFRGKAGEVTALRELTLEAGRGETLGIVGPSNIQCFREADGTHYVTDINPRFGGGFPLPTAAGSRYPELALALARGERPEPRVGDFREGVVMTRFFSEICLVESDGRLAPLEAAEQTVS
jgi:carbamoyl-phosphate synthase large subunit